MTVTAYVALGSNLGDRRASLDRALTSLAEHPSIKVEHVSTYLETEPVGGPAGQGRYLNAVARIDTSLAPEELMRYLLEVEKRLGRIRQERFSPRTIDLDLLLFGQHTCETRDLRLPHPRMHEREFVLRPLAEIAPQVIHPELGLTAHQMLEELQRSSPAPSISAPVSGKELKGKRALVTGSTSGIGKAIALELADAGADVIIHGRSMKIAYAVHKEVETRGVRSGVLLADLPDMCDSLAESAWKAWGGLDIWVNNAGADTLTGEAARWPFERKLETLWDVDVRATMLLSRNIGERMRKNGGGVIVNMGWDQAETGMEGDSGQMFAAVKGAVMAFSKSLACTLAPEVRVNCIAPGWIRTAWGENASEVWQNRVMNETPMRRWGTPQDVAAVVRWLVSPAAAFLTGQTIRINGGAVR